MEYYRVFASFKFKNLLDNMFKLIISFAWYKFLGILLMQRRYLFNKEHKKKIDEIKGAGL